MLNFLELYAAVGKYGFYKTFGFEIFIEEHLEIKDPYIPPMIIQPYLEICIMRTVSNNGEKIKLELIKKNDSIICIIKEYVRPNPIEEKESSNPISLFEENENRILPESSKRAVTVTKRRLENGEG